MIDVAILSPEINGDNKISTNLSKIFEGLHMHKRFKENRLLVVDDEEFCLASMKAILFNLGFDTKFQVDFCINGKEALDHIVSSTINGFSYRAILTDISMPVMDGIEATKQIR